MAVKKVTILLTEPEFNLLAQRAVDSCRSTQEQARYIIRRSLIASLAAKRNKQDDSEGVNDGA